MEKQLNIAQCDDQQKVFLRVRTTLGRSPRLLGGIRVWTSCHAPPVTWQEFKENFRSYHIPKGLIELKQEEFRALKQGSMSVAEYRDKFAQLSRYVPNEVADDADK